MNPSQKENHREQTYFRLSVKRGSHPGRPNTRCSRPGGRQQDHHLLEGEDRQEASQQESSPSQQQRETRCQVIDDGDGRNLCARIGRPPIGTLFRALCVSAL